MSHTQNTQNRTVRYISLIGAPFSGKNRQADFLINTLAQTVQTPEGPKSDTVIFDPGKEFRNVQDDPTHPDHAELVEFNEKNPGQLVPKELSNRILYGKLEQYAADPDIKVIISVGSPRSEEQRDTFETYRQLKSQEGIAINDIPVFFQVSKNNLMRRGLQRLNDSISDLVAQGTPEEPSKIDAYMAYLIEQQVWTDYDEIKAELDYREIEENEVRRDDLILEERLKVFADQTQPMIDAYSREGKLVIVDANGSPEEVSQLLLEGLRPALDLPEREPTLPAAARR